MKNLNRLYIHGEWVAPSGPPAFCDVVNPATELAIGRLSLASAGDVDKAVASAKAAFPDWAASSVETRAALLEKVIQGYRARSEELAQALCLEIGAPIALGRQAQTGLGLAQLQAALYALREFSFKTTQGRNYICHEPIGVAALITAWNWPLVLITSKVAAALAAGCTMVLEPSELAPLSALIFAEIMHDAGTPPGVFNMILGEGSVAGAALTSHRDVDMVSFTGSTRAGVDVAISAAPSVKRVAQELGGKSPLIILDDADLATAVKTGFMQVMTNSGQTCTAPTRMLVPRARYQDAVGMATAAADALVVGAPANPATQMGTVANQRQFDKVQRMIALGIEEGATVVAGGPGRPQGLEKGLFVQPTVFANVRNDMAIAQEEIFGPVLGIVRDTYRIFKHFLDGDELEQEGKPAWLGIVGTD